MKSRVLLWNLPYRKQLVLKDFSSSHTPKSLHYWPPVDLLVLSGILSSRFEVSVLDSNALRTSARMALAQVVSEKPDVIVGLISSLTIHDDVPLLEAVRRHCGIPIIGVGDLASFCPEDTLTQYPVFDAMLRSFTTSKIVEYLEGRREGLEDLVFRSREGRIVSAPQGRHPRLSYPMPRHELFPLRRYRMPFGRHQGISAVISQSGCPWNCSFCEGGQMPSQLRDVEEVVEELAYLERLGLKEVFVRDYTFGPSASRAKELCETILKRDVKLAWSADCRVDRLEDDELVRLMKEAGCYLAMFGIEIEDVDQLNMMNKRMPSGAVPRALDLCQKHGIQTLGHFILGFPGESSESMKRTIVYSRRLNLDYGSFNLFVPRLGSRMREEMEQRRLVMSGDYRHDVSVNVGDYSRVSNAELRKIYRKAVFGFYLRPRQIWRLVRGNRWSVLLRAGVSLLLQQIFSLKITKRSQGAGSVLSGVSTTP